MAHSYPFTEVLYNKGIYNRLYYYNNIKDLGKFLTESVKNKKGKILITSKIQHTIIDFEKTYV